MTSTPTHRTDQQASLLAEWVEVRRQINALEARAAALLGDRLALMDADVAETPLHRNAIERSMIAEYTAAGRMAKGGVEHAFANARTLRDSFPAVRESFEAGEIAPAHVREILTAASPVQQAISDGEAHAQLLELFEAAALEFAEVEAPARTRAHVREFAAALAPRTITERHADALAEQCVSVRAVTDELSLLTALMPTHRAEAIMDRLTAMARQQRQQDREPTLPMDEQFEAEADRSVEVITAGGTFTVDPFAWNGPVEDDPTDTPEAVDAYLEMMDRAIAQGPVPVLIPEDPRGIDRIRTELLTDLLLTANPGDILGDGAESITAHIQVTVAASTLAGADENPAQLDGVGALHPDTARALAGKATSWTRLFLDTDGMVTATDTYQPTAGMKRFLQARDQHCRFPGCRQPVHRTQLDHTHDWALGGQTSIDNLAHLCLTHHALKHPSIPDRHRWTVRQLPDWTLEWTSPNGSLHRDRPPRRVMFVPSDPAPASFDWNAPIHGDPSF
ncbi:HNH endonuclease signature motif containing protein [Microbacterium sp. 22195]|uniref:HNH endonuclease signature motif containing protein n=1 Tax=Microbacterium sp. 22195 TaxID=3453891 RepID=UPI003F83E33B